jgi:hypothetical protein
VYERCRRLINHDFMDEWQVAGDGRVKSGPKSRSKGSPNKRAPQTDFIHAGLAQIDFKCEFAKVVKNAVQGAPH